MRATNDITPSVTRDRVQNALKELGLVYMTDSDGDTVVSIFPYLLYVVTEGSNPVIGVAAAPRAVDVQFTDEVARAVATHNANFYAPKMFSMVSDEGKIRFRLSHCFNWDAGATDEQISSELDAFLHACMDAFSKLDEAFPDPWATGEAPA